MANLERDLFKFIIQDKSTARGIKGWPSPSYYEDFNQNLVYPFLKYGLDLELMEVSGLYPPGTAAFTPNNIETLSKPTISLANDPIVLKWRCYNIEKINDDLPESAFPSGQWLSLNRSAPWKVGCKVTVFTELGDDGYHRDCIVTSRDVVRNVNAPYISITLAPLFYGWIANKATTVKVTDNKKSITGSHIAPMPFQVSCRIKAAAVSGCQIDIYLDYTPPSDLHIMDIPSDISTLYSRPVSTMRVTYYGFTLPESAAEKTFLFDSANPLTAAITYLDSEDKTQVISLAPYLVNTASGVKLTSPAIYIPQNGQSKVRLAATGGGASIIGTKAGTVSYNNIVA